MSTAIEKKPNGSDFALTPLEPQKLTPMDLLNVALSKDAAIDVIERLANLQRESMQMDAQREFNDSMNRCQDDIRRVAPDLENPQTHSRYASYAAIDRVVRPVYSRQGFSLSFDTADCPIPEHVRVVCYCSKGLHTRRYQVDMPADGKGAKGADVMTKTHATGAAMSYGMRYLLKFIFNIAVGVDDNDGNTNGEVTECIEWIENANSQDERKKMYAQAYNKFEANPAALKIIIAANRKRKEELDRDGR